MAYPRCSKCNAELKSPKQIARHEALAAPVYAYNVGEKLNIGTIRVRRFLDKDSHVVEYYLYSRIPKMTGWYQARRIASLVREHARILRESAEWCE